MILIYKFIGYSGWYGQEAGVGQYNLLFNNHGTRCAAKEKKGCGDINSCANNYRDNRYQEEFSGELKFVGLGERRDACRLGR